MLHFNFRLISFSFAILLWAVPFSLTAQTIVFDNGVGGATGIDDALQSDADPLPENNNMVEIAADDFSVAKNTLITNVQWVGLYAVSNTPAVDNFVIRIYTDKNGPSGTPLATFEVGNNVNRTDSGQNFQLLLDVFEYSAEINFVANAGTTYWLSIDARSFADNNDTWFWGSLSTTGNAHNSPDLNNWSQFGHSTSMVLMGTEKSDDLVGDVNCDGVVDLLDVAPFVDLITDGGFSAKADINGDGVVDLLDVGPFVDLIVG
jgi:hypothetical protein